MFSINLCFSYLSENLDCRHASTSKALLNPLELKSLENAFNTHGYLRSIVKLRQLFVKKLHPDMCHAMFVKIRINKELIKIALEIANFNKPKYKISLF